MNGEICPTVTLTVFLPGIKFADDDERIRFQDAVQSAAEFHEALIDPENHTDLLIRFGDSVLEKHRFDPIAWSENLWSVVSAARLQLIAKISPVSGNA